MRRISSARAAEAARVLVRAKRLGEDYKIARPLPPVLAHISTFDDAYAVHAALLAGTGNVSAAAALAPSAADVGAAAGPAAGQHPRPRLGTRPSPRRRARGWSIGTAARARAPLSRAMLGAPACVSARRERARRDGRAVRAARHAPPPRARDDPRTRARALREQSASTPALAVHASRFAPGARDGDGTRAAALKLADFGGVGALVTDDVDVDVAAPE